MRRKWINNSRDDQVRPTYLSWRNMRSRCHNSKSTRFSEYGARGIEVCERWFNNFDAFVDDMGFRPNNTTLDRIDGAKGYSPDNCRWATAKQQAENRSSTKFIEINGETMTQADWGRKFELSSSQISARIKKGIGIGPRLRRKVAEHGTTGMYDNQNCRCDACKEAKHQADKARWQRHKQSDL